ncbi:PucR family transcriptional regulator [Plantactinospora sp. WMMB782]|uniref:PucR family transcriptional regulator n=1 Tax=Plantactinospora sp. WMMB782 TaxID=3404121 RepID=UPI003B92DE11
MLDDLGSMLLELVHGDPERAEPVGAVAIHDPDDNPVLPPRALVLGVGVSDPAVIVDLIGQVGAQQAVALILRSSVPATPPVRAAADEAGVVLLGLRRGAPWAHLAAMLRSLLAEGEVGVAESESLLGLPSGDLFAVANAIAALIDAPITIEDRSSRVLAFSGRQEEADAPRVEVILGRQVPERYMQVLTERGVFRELLRTDQPVRIDPIGDGRHGYSMPRWAVSVRAGDEVLGSIWAATCQDLTEERAEALRDAAKLVALHLMRLRAGTDVQRRLRVDLLSSALEGGAGARSALERLGLAGQPLLLLGAALSPGGGSGADDPAFVQERQRLGDAFAVYLHAVQPRSTTALVGGIAYGLLPSAPGDTDARGQRLAADFLDRIGDRYRPVVGIGPVARDVSELVHARTCVDRTLRVLVQARGGRRTARIDDVHVESLLLELRDLAAARGDGPTGGIRTLIEYDRRHGTRLVDTLATWLDHYGDVAAAAQSSYVHPNTFRYRLRRLAEVGDINLRDPDERFAAMLQLRLLVPRPQNPPA